jgi:hypothetical protein
LTGASASAAGGAKVAGFIGMALHIGAPDAKGNKDRDVDQCPEAD